MEPIPPPQDPMVAHFARRDQEDLDRLVLFHKIMAGLLAAGSCCGVPHFTIGVLTLTGSIALGTSESKQGRPEDAFLFGPLFAGIGFAIMCGALTMSFFNFRASKWLAGREKLTPLYVISAVNLLFQPVGLALGVYTFVVLGRQSVKSQFGSIPP